MGSSDSMDGVAVETGTRQSRKRKE